MASADGRDLTRLTDSKAHPWNISPSSTYELQWFPDSSKLLFGTHIGFICSVSSDGSNVTQLAQGACPILLADGTKIVYMSADFEDPQNPKDIGIYVMNSDGSTKTYLTPEVGYTGTPWEIMVFPYGTMELP